MIETEKELLMSMLKHASLRKPSMSFVVGDLLNFFNTDASIFQNISRVIVELENDYFINIEGDDEDIRKCFIRLGLQGHSLLEQRYGQFSDIVIYRSGLRIPEYIPNGLPHAMTTELHSYQEQELADDRSRNVDRDAFAPGSDRIVTFSDNEEAVAEAQKKLEVAEQAIRASNTLPPVERELWSELLRHGRDLLKRPTTYAVAISALLLKPLHDAYSSVLEDSAKPIIKAALDAVIKLIGL